MERLEDVADKLVRYARDLAPHHDIHETGALLVSTGIFLIASSIPDVWPRLRGTAELANQLLLKTEHGKDQRGNDSSSSANS